MYNENETVQWTVRPITVIATYTNEQGYQEIICTGFLTSEHYAMYLSDTVREIVFVGVLPSREPDVYIAVTYDMPYFALGRIGEPAANLHQLISDVTVRLKCMSAYDFIIAVLMNVGEAFEFGDMVIPGILNVDVNKSS